MADYCMINDDGRITNILVAETPFALPGVVLKQYYDGAEIGAKYDPPHEPTAEENAEKQAQQVMQENESLKQQVTDLQNQILTMRLGV